MLVLIDESGDPGFKFNRGSSTHFVVAMVVFASFDEAEKCSLAIKDLQEKCHIFPEFKFSGCRDNARDMFFKCIEPFDFSIYALAVPKKNIYSRTLKTDVDIFYNFFVRQLLSCNSGLLKDAHIKIDESGDRKFKTELIKYIRRMMPDGKIKKISFKASKGDHLIQLADMVTGAIARTYTDKKDHTRWNTMILPKISNLWKYS